jgi:hypothetical protein
MKSRDFCFWLQGFFELHEAGPKRGEPYDDNALNGHQVEMISRHLALVFKHEIDPAAGDAVHQGELNAIHVGKTDIALDPNHPNILMRC